MAWGKVGQGLKIAWLIIRPRLKSQKISRISPHSIGLVCINFCTIQVIMLLKCWILCMGMLKLYNKNLSHWIKENIQENIDDIYTWWKKMNALKCTMTYNCGSLLNWNIYKKKLKSFRASNLLKRWNIFLLIKHQIFCQIFMKMIFSFFK